MQDLGALSGELGEAQSINDFGEIVGRTQLIDHTYSVGFHSIQGFVWLMSDFLPVDNVSDSYGFGYAGNMNFAGTTYDPARAYKFGGETGFLQLNDLGVESFALGMNELNHAVGSVRSATHEHATLWEFIALTDLGTLGGVNSRAFGINNVDQIVGESDTSNGMNHAFLWESGTMTDLNDLLPANSGWELNDARDINEDGAIVGSATINGQTHAFLLSPAGPTIPTTSEWGLVALTLALLTVGTIVLNRRCGGIKHVLRTQSLGVVSKNSNVRKCLPRSVLCSAVFAR